MRPNNPFQAPPPAPPPTAPPPNSSGSPSIPNSASNNNDAVPSSSSATAAVPSSSAAATATSSSGEAAVSIAASVSAAATAPTHFHSIGAIEPQDVMQTLHQYFEDGELWPLWVSGEKDGNNSGEEAAKFFISQLSFVRWREKHHLCMELFHPLLFFKALLFSTSTSPNWLSNPSTFVAASAAQAAFQQKVNSPIDVGVSATTTLAIKLMAPLIM